MVVRIKPPKAKDELSLDDICKDFSAKLSEYKELKWEEALAKVPSIELQGHMSDLDIITDAVLLDEATQAALKAMCRVIQQRAWTKMRKRLLEGIHFWYKTKLSNIIAGKALLAVAEAKRNGTIEDAEFEEVEDEMVRQFEATVEHIQQSGTPPTDDVQPSRTSGTEKLDDKPRGVVDTITETTAEEAIAQAMSEESEANIGSPNQGS